MLKKTIVTELAAIKTLYYKVPLGKRTSWLMTWMSNTSNSNTDVNLYYYNAETDTEVPIFESFVVTSKTFLDIGGQYNEFIEMRELDEIRASCVGSATVILSLVEDSDIIKGG